MGVSASVPRTESWECLLAGIETDSPRGGLDKRISSRRITIKNDDSTDECILACRATLIDCCLRAVCSGKLELRTCRLKFSDHGRSFTWPLTTLRWYGANKHFFVFESGRRCASGPGLFIFMCKRPKRLDDRLDRQIHHLSSRQATDSTKHHPLPLPGPVIPDMDYESKLLHLDNWRNQGEENPVSETSTGTQANDDGDSTWTTPSRSPENEEDNDETHITWPVSQHGQSPPANYLDALPSPALTSGPMDQYLIAVAPHSYVNQPNRWIADTERVVNDYVIQPT